MQPSAFAIWLNTFFADFDRAILEFFHMLAEKAGFVLTPVSRVLDVIIRGGLVFLLLALVFILFKKTRFSGLCVFGSLAVAVAINNIILKWIVARPRPFTVDEFREFWEFVGGLEQSGFSFPSGHATTSMAVMLVLCITLRKKWLVLPSAIAVIFMCASRNYLMVHYPTDVIAGMIVGIAAAILTYFVAKFMWSLIGSWKRFKFFSFIIDADISMLFKKRKVEE